MLFGNHRQLLGGGEDVSLLGSQVWGGGCLPFPAPRAAGGAGQDAGTHPKVWKALTRRKVHQRGPLIEDISGR